MQSIENIFQHGKYIVAYVLKIYFWYLLVIDVNFSVKNLIFSQKVLFLFSAYFWWYFCNHSHGKINTRLLHFIELKQLKEIVERQF